MRLTISKSPNATNIFVIEDVKENGKRTTRVVESLGSVKELEAKLNGQDPIEWAQAYVKELNEKKSQDQETVIQKLSTAKQIPKEKINKVQSGYLFLQSIYNGLELDKICHSISSETKTEYNLDSILSRLLYTRILNPSSKRSSYEASLNYIEPPDFSLHQVYRALSLLSQNIEKIEMQVYKNSLQLVERNTKVLYYDCTNYFFEIEEEDSLRKYGVGKQHQPNPLVQMGLFMDGSGMPLAFCIDEGSKNEQNTLTPLEKRIIKDFNLSEFIVCTDAGLGSTDNRKFNNKQNRSYIVTQSIKRLKAHLKEWALDPTGWHLPNVDADIDIRRVSDLSSNTRIYYKERWINEDGLSQRLIVTYSPKYKNYMRTIRGRQIERAQALADKPTKLKQKRSNDPKRFLSSTHCTQDGEIAQKELVRLDVDRIANEEQYDGFYGVCTNLEGDVDDILKINRRRWEIEESFRILKSEFKARPVHLSREDRIRAHFLTCFLSLLILRILEQKIENKYTVPEIISTLRDMEMVPIKSKGYIPAYTRTDLTDTLHEKFGFQTDREVLTQNMMKKIIQHTENPKTLRKK
jgi:transposase